MAEFFGRNNWWWLDVTNTFRHQVFAVFQIILLLTQSFASPVWMPQFLSGGTGRNIRHLPCVSRRTGEQGTCMFAYTCMKANGTHLGTCIDRFYFGSCCKLDGGSDPLLENDIHYPLLNNNKVTGDTDWTSIPQNNLIKNSTTPTIAQESKATTTEKSKPTTIVTSEKPRSTTTSTTEKIRFTTSKTTTTKNPTKATTTTTKKPNKTPTITTTKKPTKTPTKTTTSTRKPPVKKPTTSKPSKTTTPRTSSSTKKPTTTTKKPSINITSSTNRPTPTIFAPQTFSTTSQKPVFELTTKNFSNAEFSTFRPTAKPTSAPAAGITTFSYISDKISTITVSPSVNNEIVTGNTPASTATTLKVTKKPSTTTKTTTNRPFVTSTIPPILGDLSTTSEVVFTKPGSLFVSPNITNIEFSTFRPDLNENTKPSLVTGPGLSTFSYIPHNVTTASSISNEIVTEKTSTPLNSVEVDEEQSNVIFQQTSTSPHLSSEATVPFFPEVTSESTKVPWVEITQEQSDLTTTTALPTTETIENTTSAETVTFSPSFGDVNVSDFTQVCGRRLYPESRVVGGEKSTFGKWPWQISLRQWRTSTYLHKCGAALLNENWAITAAHCVENVPPSDLLLRLGEHDLSTEEEPYGYQERRVQIVASHPQFDPRTFEYDLALLRFYEPVKFQPNIIPICVPEDSTNFVGQTAHVTGWGRLYEDGPLPSVLQEVSVPVINNTICENMYRSAGYIEHIPDIFICAGWKKGGFDSCEGDSGGPMVIRRLDRRWVLAGVISWGIGCAEPNQPGVYTRISEFREWINQILQF